MVEVVNKVNKHLGKEEVTKCHDCADACFIRASQNWSATVVLSRSEPGTERVSLLSLLNAIAPAGMHTRLCTSF